MKKVIFVIVLLLLLPSFALDYSSMCATKSPSKTFGGTISSLTGINFLTRQIAENQIQKALKKETNSKFKVKVENFFGVSLTSGNFGYVSAESKNLYYQGFYFSNFIAEAICPYNSVSFDDKNNVSFEENMILKYTTIMSEEDLQKTINSEEYKKFMNKINNDNVLSAFISIRNPNIKIKDENIIFEYEIAPLPKIEFGEVVKSLMKPVKVSMQANLKVEDGKIELCNFKINNTSYARYEKILALVNSFNPLTFGVNPIKDTRGEIKIDDVKVANSSIQIVGYLIIPKEAK